MNSRERYFWLSHGLLPLVAFVLCSVLLHTTSFDFAFARAWAWNADAGRWLGERSWWAGPVLHRGGRDAVIAVLAALTGVALAGLAHARWRALRSGAVFVLLAMIASWALVGGLKQVTGVDCPRDLAAFGGTRPYAAVLAARAAAVVPAGACFPGAHSASGFALFAFYFALRDRSPGRARIALCAAGAVGTSFALGQEARGAHFLSHDLTSAFLVWFTCLGAYCAWRRPRAGQLFARRRVSLTAR